MPTPLETRIINIQKQLKVASTGAFDLATCTAMEQKLNIAAGGPALIDRAKGVQKALGFTGKDIDGDVGPGTVSRVEQFLSKELPAVPAGASMTISKKSMDIVVESEVSSMTVYNKRWKFPALPGEDSGVTIGIGYDMGQVTAAGFRADWGNVLSTKDFNLLSTTLGKKKAAAAAVLPGVKAVEIPWEKALQVFYSSSLPVYAKETRRAFPGVEKLPPDAQGALVSLVYNRGGGIDNTDRRKEMKNIVGHVAAGNLKKIADELRAMKRLWDIKTSAGLHIRRDREADLVQNANFNFMPNEVIFV